MTDLDALDEIAATFSTDRIRKSSHLIRQGNKNMLLLQAKQQAFPRWRLELRMRKGRAAAKKLREKAGV